LALSLAQVLNDTHYALGAWSDNQVFLQQAMTGFATDNDLIAYLQANKNNPQITGNLSQNFPPWALQALGDQVGASAAYLNTELAPIIVEAAAQGWDSAHLTNAIQQTPYWQQHNNQQLSWQTQSPAERSVVIDQMQAKMAAEARNLYGPDWTGGAIPGLTFEGLRTAAELVSSGGMTYDVWQYMTQKAAESAPNTPAAQAVMQTRKQAGQEAVNVSNIAQRLGDTWRAWMGDQYPPPADLAAQAQKISMNLMSEADFLKNAKTMSAQLYPNKPANLDYSSWVQQPKSVLAGTLELPSVKDSDLLLQSFIRPGSTMNLGDLKLAAMQDPRRDATLEQKQQSTQAATQILSTWGLAPGPGL
jgi:hypothetical protein